MLKKKIIEKLVLTLPYFNNPFLVKSDSSNDAIAVVLH